MNNERDKIRVVKKSKKYYVIVGLFILAIAVVHFAMQITFIQKENLRSVETAVEVDKSSDINAGQKTPVNQIIGIEPQQIEVRKVEVITIPETVKIAPRRQKEIAPAKLPDKSKTVREPKPERNERAERLRRAERILTGI